MQQAGANLLQLGDDRLCLGNRSVDQPQDTADRLLLVEVGQPNGARSTAPIGRPYRVSPLAWRPKYRASRCWPNCLARNVSRLHLASGAQEDQVVSAHHDRAPHNPRPRETPMSSGVSESLVMMTSPTRSPNRAISGSVAEPRMNSRSLGDVVVLVDVDVITEANGLLARVRHLVHAAELARLQRTRSGAFIPTVGTPALVHQDPPRSSAAIAEPLECACERRGDAVAFLPDRGQWRPVLVP